MNDSYVNDYTPPVATTHTDSGVAASSQADPEVKELLEDQNIFFLLGASEGTDAEKSQFLDDLQQVIWEDFLENDVSLLILDAEHQKLTEIIGASTANLSVETQEKIIEYLEEIVPDLEDIMVDKAVRLKADLLRERVESLKTLYADDATKVSAVMHASALMQEGKWATAAKTLNEL